MHFRRRLPFLASALIVTLTWTMVAWVDTVTVSATDDVYTKTYQCAYGNVYGDAYEGQWYSTVTGRQRSCTASGGGGGAPPATTPPATTPPATTPPDTQPSTPPAPPSKPEFQVDVKPGESVSVTAPSGNTLTVDLSTTGTPGGATVSVESDQAKVNDLKAKASNAAGKMTQGKTSSRLAGDIFTVTSDTGTKEFDVPGSARLVVAVDIDEELVMVFRVTTDAQGKETVETVFTWVGSVAHVVPGTGSYVPTLIDTEFPDVGAQHWAHRGVKVMAAHFVVNGYPDGTYGPERDVTRAEFAKMAAIALNLPKADARSLPFIDVPANAWYRDVLAAAYKAGLIAGYPDRTFRSDGKITREELNTILGRYLAAKGIKAQTVAYHNLTKYADGLDTSVWAMQATGLVIEQGILKDLPGNRLNPSSNAKRAEVAQFLYRMWQKH